MDIIYLASVGPIGLRIVGGKKLQYKVGPIEFEQIMAIAPLFVRYDLLDLLPDIAFILTDEIVNRMTNQQCSTTYYLGKYEIMLYNNVKIFDKSYYKIHLMQRFHVICPNIIGILDEKFPMWEDEPSSLILSTGKLGKEVVLQFYFSGKESVQLFSIDWINI